MRKSLILIALLFITAFVNPITIAVTSQDNSFFTAVVVETNGIDEPTTIHPDKMSYNNGTWAQWTTTAFTLDGNIAEWDTEGIISETFGGVTIYLAYDATNVYVAASWADSSYSTDVSEWNKIDNADGFEMLAGDDDVITVGFDDGINADFWTWTASNRTADAYALEHAGNGTLDSGTLPYVMNTNSTDFAFPSAPLWDNNWDPILDYWSIPEATKITGWYPNETTPTGSQTDVAVGWNHTGTHYVVEFNRALDTGNIDDMVLDFTNNDLWFEIGIENQNEAFDFVINTSSHLIFHQNTPAELTFDEPPEYVNDSLLLTGTVFDDYSDYSLTVWLDTWFYPWIPPANITIDKITGNWSHLLIYNESIMPLDYTNVTVTLKPQYEDEIKSSHIYNVEDIEAPDIFRVHNVTNSYPYGVPGNVGMVLLSAGINDNYNEPDNLVVDLYHYKDQEVALSEPMDQSSPGSHTFYASITIDPEDDYGIEHEYHYFVQATDMSLNIKTSTEYIFHTIVTSNPTPTITPTTIIFGLSFNSILSSLILTGCLIIIVRYKKQKIAS